MDIFEKEIHSMFAQRQCSPRSAWVGIFFDRRGCAFFSIGPGADGDLGK
jgi:hypothetical protein